MSTLRRHVRAALRGDTINVIVDSWTWTLCYVKRTWVS